MRFRKAGTSYLQALEFSTISALETLAKFVSKKGQNPYQKKHLAMLTTPAGDIVLDCFGGSGSTLIAAEQCGRKARLIEIDPHYCDVIIHRWEELTGKKHKILNREENN